MRPKQWGAQSGKKINLARGDIWVKRHTARRVASISCAALSPQFHVEVYPRKTGEFFPDEQKRGLLINFRVGGGQAFNSFPSWNAFGKSGIDSLPVPL